MELVNQCWELTRGEQQKQKKKEWKQELHRPRGRRQALWGQRKTAQEGQDHCRLPEVKLGAVKMRSRAVTFSWPALLPSPLARSWAQVEQQHFPCQPLATQRMQAQQQQPLCPAQPARCDP